MPTSAGFLELHRELGEMRQDIGRLQGTLDTFIGQLKVQDDRTSALDLRTRRVEYRQHWYAGLASAFGMILGGVSSRFWV